MTKPGPAQIGEHKRKQNSGIICLQKILLKVKDTENFKVTGYTKIYPADTNQKKLVAQLCTYLGKLYFTVESITRYKRLTFGTDYYRT